MNPSVKEAGFSSAEVAAIAGVTLRQLQWWDEKKLIMPGRKGWNRVYDTQCLIDSVVVAEFRRRGVSLQIIRRYLRQLQRQLLSLVEWIEGDRDVFVIAEQRSATAVKTMQAAITLACDSGVL